MSFIPYQNYGAGLGAIGPVQTMSDRAENQTLMANNGQMFASGGLASLAEGGSTALPKYKYDPVLQRYTLVGPEGEVIDEELELLKRKRAAEESRSSSYSPLESNYVSPSGQKLGEALASAGIGYSKVLGGMLPLAGLAGLLGERYIDNRLSEAARLGGHTGTYTGYAAFGDRPNNTMTEQQTQDAIRGIGGGPLSGAAWGTEPDYANTVGLPGGMTGYQTGENGLPSEIGGSAPPGSEANSDTPDSGGKSGDVAGIASGGLAALAAGGQSHLGDYSDGGRLLRGPGDGVSDSIPAVIGKKRPARLADGEFVVPARIVSELGNGSTEAGARKLYAMMDRIQKGRKKSIGKDRVAVNSRADKNLPA